MKLDSEAVRHHSSLPFGPPKIVIYDDKSVETEVLKETNEDGREGKHEITSVLEGRNYENADPLATEKCDGDGLGYDSRPHKYDDNEDSCNGRVNESGEVTTSCVVSTTESPLPENETALYTDKTVTGIELPELMACLKENVVKDICIDEGVPSMDKTLVGHEEADHKRYIGILQSELDEYSDLTKGTDANALPISDDLKSLVIDGQLISSKDKEVTNKCRPGSLQVELGGNFDSTGDVVNDMTDEKVIPEKSHLVQNLDVGNHHADSFSSDRHDDPEHSDQKHSWNAMDSADIRSEGCADEANLATSMVPSAHEIPNQSRDGKDFPFDSKAKSGCIIYNFDSSSQTTSIGAENSSCQQSGRSLNASVLEDDALDSLTGSTRSFFIQHGVGESSFSGIGSVSGPLVGTSFRSDSSTTSTRSFAFPVLHSEWNSSPVKMAKADRRHFRKHRGWRMALLCCRF